MHYVSRGPEPKELKPIRIRYTQKWIDYYPNRVGRKPTDTKWRDFKDELSFHFNECCGYCETICRGEVDHFRPKTKYPAIVYHWDNWIFSCHDCNQNKGDYWPHYGFIDPCAITDFCHGPNCCFIYDLLTGEALPHPELSSGNTKRAKAMIKSLVLNGSFQLKKRLSRIRMLDTLAYFSTYDHNLATQEIALLALPSAALHSLTKYYIETRLPQLCST
ncbi:HNH endonuclease [Chloroflexota bacterium]